MGSMPASGVTMRKASASQVPSKATVRANACPDAVVTMLWLQLALGLVTVPLSASHMDGVLFETLVAYVKGVVTFNGEVAGLMLGVPLTYKLHILLGFTIFLISPFTRMIHNLERHRGAGLSVPA